MTKDLNRGGVMDKCPFCGAVKAKEGAAFVCGTGEDSGYFGRECWANQLTQAQARIKELEADLTKYAVLKANKDLMPPGASLVFCYEINGTPVLADDLYPDFVVVRRDDLDKLDELSAARVYFYKDGNLRKRIKAALDPIQKWLDPREETA